MKLQTAIPARRDGTVIVQGLDGQRYVFTKDQDNELSCDVTDDATVVHLLAGKNFWPADERDAEAARIAKPGRKPRKAATPDAG